MTNTIISLIMQFSSLHHLNPVMVLAVIKTESNFNANAVGSAGEIGLLQLMPSNFPYMTRKELMDPATNIALGTAYLAHLRDKECKYHVDNTFLVCYNYGSANTKKVKYPKSFPYYKRVMKQMKQYTVSSR